MGGMNDLPFDVSLDIFSRLNVDLILDCKLVCKTWCKLIRNPSFPHVYLARHKLLLQKLHVNDIQDTETFQAGFFIFDPFGTSYNSRLIYVQYNVDVDKKSCKIKKRTINIPPINKFDLDISMIKSCHGLICSTVRHSKLHDPIHIFNPITREYVFLPRYEGDSKDGAYNMVSGFGYSPSTDEYKVVRIYQKGRGGAWYFQVYILGNESNEWKEEKRIPSSLFQDGWRYSRGVVVNGEIYWLIHSSKIVAFSLANEEFHCVVSPPVIERNFIGSLCAVGDLLCLVHVRNAHVDIWLFKKNNDMNVPQNGTWNWNKEFTVETETERDLIPLAFTKKGKVLFWQDSSFVSSYDPNTAVLEKFSMNKIYDKVDLVSHQPVQHINSFVSLKALGVKNIRRRKQYTRLEIWLANRSGYICWMLWRCIWKSRRSWGRWNFCSHAYSYHEV